MSVTEQYNNSNNNNSHNCDKGQVKHTLKRTHKLRSLFLFMFFFSTFGCAYLRRNAEFHKHTHAYKKYASVYVTCAKYADNQKAVETLRKNTKRVQVWSYKFVGNYLHANKFRSSVVPRRTVCAPLFVRASTRSCYRNERITFRKSVS